MHSSTMFWLLKKFWVALVTFATLVGIFYIPADISQSDEAAGPWQKVFAMVDQNTALWTFAVCASIYILIIDLRPVLNQWFRSPVNFMLTKPIRINGGKNKETIICFEAENRSSKSIVGIQCWQEYHVGGKAEYRIKTGDVAP